MSIDKTECWKDGVRLAQDIRGAGVEDEEAEVRRRSCLDGTSAYVRGVALKWLRLYPKEIEV